jgi:hypothetical protein
MCTEIITVYSGINARHSNKLCSQNVDFLGVKTSGIQSSQWKEIIHVLASNPPGT